MSRFLPDLAGTLQENFRIADIFVRSNGSVAELRRTIDGELANLLARDGNFGNGTSSVTVTIDHGDDGSGVVHTGELAFSQGSYIRETDNPQISGDLGLVIQGVGNTNFRGSGGVVIASHLPQLSQFSYADDNFQYSDIIEKFTFQKIVQIVDNESATSTTSGALQVAGGISTQENLFVGGVLSSSQGFALTQTHGVNQDIESGSWRNVLIGDDIFSRGNDNVIIGREAGYGATTDSGSAVIIGSASYSNRGDVVVIGNSASTDRARSVVIGRSAYGGGISNTVMGHESGIGSISDTHNVLIGEFGYIEASRNVGIGARSSVFNSAGNAIALGALAVVEGGDYSICFGSGASVLEQDRLLQIGGNSSHLALENRVGSFIYGEVITGGTSGATALVLWQFVQNNGWIKVQNTNGINFVVGETITGSSSGATANIVSSVGSGWTINTEVIGDVINRVRFGRGLNTVDYVNPSHFEQAITGDVSLNISRDSLSSDFVRFRRNGGGGYEFGVSSAGGNRATWSTWGPSNSRIETSAWQSSAGPTGTTSSVGSAIHALYSTGVGIEFPHDNLPARLFGRPFHAIMDFSVLSTTEATSPSAGALHVLGGLAVEKQIHNNVLIRCHGPGGTQDAAIIAGDANNQHAALVSRANSATHGGGLRLTEDLGAGRGGWIWFQDGNMRISTGTTSLSGMGNIRMEIANGNDNGMLRADDGNPNIAYHYNNGYWRVATNFGDSNNSYCAGYFSAESTGNEGRRTGLHGRAHRTASTTSGQIITGTVGHASMQNDSSGARLVGLYGLADRSTGATQDYFPSVCAIGVVGISRGVRQIANIGVYGFAENSTEVNWAGFFEGNVNITGVVDVRSRLQLVSSTVVLTRHSNKKVIVTDSATVSLWSTGVQNGDHVYIRNRSGGSVTIDTESVSPAITIEEGASISISDGESILLVYDESTLDWTAF